MRSLLAGGCVGLVFGVVLCWSGMSDPNVIREALLFEDSYLFLMFASAVLTAGAGLRLLSRRERRAVLTGERITCPRERPGRRHVVGSLLFGSGWALAAACPGPILTQVGQGVPWALFTLVGMAAGVYAFLRRGAAETEPPSDAAAQPAPA